MGYHVFVKKSQGVISGQETGTSHPMGIYPNILDIGRAFDLPLLLSTPTWRANREQGLKILGDCCGTDDRHIRSLAAQLSTGV